MKPEKELKKEIEKDKLYTLHRDNYSKQLLRIFKEIEGVNVEDLDLIREGLLKAQLKGMKQAKKQERERIEKLIDELDGNTYALSKDDKIIWKRVKGAPFIKREELKRKLKEQEKEK